MTDEEYVELLKALAAKHLRYPEWDPYPPPPDGRYPLPFTEHLRVLLRQLAATHRLLKVVQDRPQDVDLLRRLAGELQDSPVRRAADAMEMTGILPALDDVPQVVFENFRRTAVPREDIDLLIAAGFTPAEVEVLLAAALQAAPKVGSRPASATAYEAAATLEHTVNILIQPPQAEPKKRKLLNGIGKLLGGAVAGVGNALLWTGTVIAPNPATAYTAIASGGLAISTFFAGLGDLRGE